MKALLSLLSLLSLTIAFSDDTVTILHTNDMHSHVEPSAVGTTTLGGYARLATLVAKYRATDPHPLLVNAGDTFQGTFYFNVYEGLADAALMNYIGFQGMAVGNHEFDRGPAVLAAFARQLNCPLLSANLDVRDEPTLKGLVLPRTIVNADGVRVGLIGCTTEELPTISSSGPNVKISSVVPAVQAAVYRLASEGVNKVVVLSHCGYDVEVAMASQLRGVDVIVGGHSHTLLGNPGAGLPKGAGPYPTVCKGADGKTVLVVQAWEWMKVLGRIKVTFDDGGDVKGWADAAPIPADAGVAEDPVAKSMIAAFQRPIAATMNEVVGTAAAPLNRGAVGSLIANAMLEATSSAGAVAAFINAGGVRADLAAGKLTYGALISVQPFGNTLVVLELSGAELLSALQHGEDSGGGRLVPSSGTSYKVADGKVSDVQIAGAALDPSKRYLVTLNNFTASGGDAHETLKAAKGKRVDTGLRDIDVLIEHIKRHMQPKN